MKRIVSVILVLATLFGLVGCSKNNTDGSNSSVSESTPSTTTEGNLTKPNTPSSDNVLEDNNQNDSNENDIIQFEKINSLDKLNYYAVKKAISENDVTLLSGSAENDNHSIVSLANTTATAIDPNADFTITMYSYFTIELNDANGFLAQKLGGTGFVEVVITRNNFNNMITFKKGDRYYSCFQTALTDKAMSFSTHKYVNGFKLVENYDQENYEYTVYFDGDRVTGISCGRFDGGSNYKYVADDIRFNDEFSIVIYKKQTFTAAQLEGLFDSDDSSVDEGIVFEDDTVLLKEASVTNNPIAFKDGSGLSVLGNNDIKTVSAMYNEEFGYFIKLTLNSEIEIPDERLVSFYNNESKDRNLILQSDGKAAYITLLSNQSQMLDVFYKLTDDDESNQIGRIIDYAGFVKEISKKLNLDDYNRVVEDYSEDFNYELRVVNYTYDLKTSKPISYNASNYDITIDGITITMPIRVSDFLEKGFTVKTKRFKDEILHGGATFRTPKGNNVDAYVMDFYGDSTEFNDCYITQIDFHCYEGSFKYQEGISPTRPDFEMIEGINKDSTLDDIISRLGAPRKIILYTTLNRPIKYKDCHLQLYYDLENPALPNGYIIFNVQAVLNYTDTTPPDFLTQAGMLLH